MNQEISNRMAAKLSHLDASQIEQLVVRARHLRARAQAKSRQGDTLDEWVERALRREQRELASADALLDGLVVSVTSAACLVEVDADRIDARVTTCSAVVGDRVTIGQTAGGEWAVVQVAPRRTKLSRPDVQTASLERVIVANVDVVGIVVSVVAPPLHPRLIDRYLVAIQQGGASPLICVNKIDLLRDATELGVLDPYVRLGIPVVACSVLEGSGLDGLRAALAGRTCVFVGHSGVGKSSIVNALLPSAGLAIGEVSEGYGRGTHTTTASSLHRLEGGTVLIDTPGIRSFGLRDLTKREVAGYFPEFESLACRFRDCRHDGEPGCGVVEAVEAGILDAARLDSYRRLLAGVED